jgi:hypothetical protein
MTAAEELYQNLFNNISNAIEVLISIPKNSPEPGQKMWDAKPPRKDPEGRLHSLEINFPGNLYCLAKFISELSPVALPAINNKSAMSEYLQSFRVNKDQIISLFEYVLSNPEKGYEHDYKQVTRYASCLFSLAEGIHERSVDIREQFERLILCIDSEGY